MYVTLMYRRKVFLRSLALDPVPVQWTTADLSNLWRFREGINKATWQVTVANAVKRNMNEHTPAATLTSALFGSGCTKRHVCAATEWLAKYTGQSHGVPAPPFDGALLSEGRV